MNNRIINITLFTVLVTLFCTSSIAGDRFSVTGNMLMEWVKDSNNKTPNWSSGMVTGFVAGVSDSTSTIICFPSGVTNNQIEAVVIKFLKDNPEMWDIPAVDIVTKALFNTWACPIKNID
jgi:ammonia channel protein AmtB